MLRVSPRARRVRVLVRVERDDDEISTAREDARRLTDGARRLVGVNEHVEHEHLIEALALLFERVHVAARHAHVVEFSEALLRRVDHALARVDARDRFCARRDHLRDRAVARAHVEHAPEPQETHERRRERLPRSTRRVVALHLTGDRLGKISVSRAHHVAHAIVIAREHRIAHAVRDELPNAARARGHLRGERVVRRRAVPAITHEPRVTQLAEVRRHARLRHVRDQHELGDRQLVLAQQPKKPHARGLGEEGEKISGGREGLHSSMHHNRTMKEFNGARISP